MTDETDSADTFHCPHCDAVVRAGARVCRACGASDDCGWNDDTYFDDGVDEDEFDYDEFVLQKLPEKSQLSGAESQKMWLRLVILALAVSILMGYIIFQ